MIFQQAIRGDDGLVDAGYLALYWALIGWSASTTCILVVTVVACFRATPAEVPAIIQAAGVAWGAVSVGFATVAGGVGAFRAGDKPRVATTITTATQTKTEPTI